MTRTVRDELFGAGRLQALLDDPRRHRRAGQRAARRVGGTGRAACAVRTWTSAAPTTSARSRSGSRPQAGSGSTTPRRAVDARLPDGTRLHAVLPPVAGACALLSLRVVRSRAFTVDELVAAGHARARAWCPWSGRSSRRRANLWSRAATGSGKTTLLAALLSPGPADERIVLVEEAGELAPAHPHVVRLLARHANVDGAGRVDLTDLVRHALRMRPDRIVLGECRGAEVREVLAALNTGHDGGCATRARQRRRRRARAARGARARSPGCRAEAVAAQAASAFDAVLHLRRRGAPAGAYLAEVGVVRRGRDRRARGGVRVARRPVGRHRARARVAGARRRLGLPAGAARARAAR